MSRRYWASGVQDPGLVDPQGVSIHGTPKGYTNYRCRCEPCKAAGIAYRTAYTEVIKARPKKPKPQWVHSYTAHSITRVGMPAGMTLDPPDIEDGLSIIWVCAVCDSTGGLSSSRVATAEDAAIHSYERHGLTRGAK